jgi:transcriptional regulator with XRE-family HTH domain
MDINWTRIDSIRRAHGWTWERIAQRIGVSGAHLSEIRAGKRQIGWKFIKCLVVGLELTWDDAILPPLLLGGAVSGREALGLHSMEDGRPYAARYNREVDLLYQQGKTRSALKTYEKEKATEERLSAWLGGA